MNRVAGSLAKWLRGALWDCLCVSTMHYTSFVKDVNRGDWKLGALEADYDAWAYLCCEDSWLEVSICVLAKRLNGFVPV